MMAPNKDGFCENLAQYLSAQLEYPIHEMAEMARKIRLI